MIITISREFSSGGREIGKRLADELGLAYYDGEIITLIAKETGMSEEYIQNISEKGVYPYTYQFAKSFLNSSPVQNSQIQVLVKQNEIIKKIASKGNCVIVGRAANVILKGEDTIDLFIYADMKSKVARCKQKADENENLSEKELEKKIIEVSKNREKFHNVVSNEEWGKKENYDLCINTSGVDIKSIITPLKMYIENWFRRN